MITLFSALNPIFQALVATIFTWGMTAIVSASYCSWLAPAINISEQPSFIKMMILDLGFGI